MTTRTAATKLDFDDLLTLEEYARRRSELRQSAIAEKKRRRLAIGDNAMLYFENRATMQYQIQEMLRVEKIFEPDGIREELESYNPMIPDGDNWKATLMLQYDDIEVRRRELERLTGIEDLIWIRIAGFDKVFAIADEDMERATEEKTSAVHFLRFQLDGPACRAALGGASLSAGIDHKLYSATVDPLPDVLTESLRADLSACA